MALRIENEKVSVSDIAVVFCNGNSLLSFFAQPAVVATASTEHSVSAVAAEASEDGWRHLPIYVTRLLTW